MPVDLATENISEDAKKRGWRRAFTLNQEGLEGNLLNKNFHYLYVSTPYYWGLVNEKTLEIVTNAEGDIDSLKAKNKEQLIEEIQRIQKFMRRAYPDLVPQIQEELDKIKKKKLGDVLE